LAVVPVIAYFQKVPHPVKMSEITQAGKLAFALVPLAPTFTEYDKEAAGGVTVAPPVLGQIEY